MASILLKDLAHSYSANPTDDSDYAIKSLTHEFKQGGAYALLGPSGCGKSTLLNIISGLLTASEGSVEFDGQEVSQLSPAERNIAQVFQFPVVYDSMTVAENLAFPLRNMKLPKAQIKQKVNDIAELLELTDIADKKARNLSADQKQKVSMARGLVRDNVSAILFDEPLTVIDPHLKWKLRRKLKQLHEQLNITMLYVTHDQLEAATFADEIALMYQGRIVQFGTPQDLFERPNHTFVGYFIGSPGMNFIDFSAYKTDSFLVPLLNSLTDIQKQELATQSSNIKLGIRPEFVEILERPNAQTVKVSIVAIEQLGTHQIVTTDFNGTHIKVRVGEFWQANNDAYYLTFPAPWLKLYIDEYLVGESMSSNQEAKGE
jgi:glycerol transport system ATP-binding protein